MSTFSLVPPFVRNYRERAINKIHGEIETVKEAVYARLQERVDYSKEFVFRSGLIALIAAVIVWTSVFLYVAFYYAYMPSICHSRPVHLQYDSCYDERGICSYPSAHVQLTKRQQLLMVGQQYKISLILEMPESSVNKQLGMFMACIYLKDRGREKISKSCRSGMLHYRSPLLETISTLVFAPMMLFGSKEQKQVVTLEMYSDFEEDQNYPVTDVHVEIQTRYIEIYSSSLNINAHFTGIRYLMYNWPILSAFAGISSNLFFITVICALSWLRISKLEFEYGSDISQYNDSNGDKNGSHFKGEVEDISNDDISLLGENGKQTDSDVTPPESQEGSEVSASGSFDLIRSSSVEVIDS